MARPYVVDLPGGTATTSVQIGQNGKLKQVVVSIHNAAVGKLECSLVASSQIGTAQPTKDVLFRLNQSATAGDQIAVVDIPTNVQPSLKTLDYLYFHSTGAGNLGNASFAI